MAIFVVFRVANPEGIAAAMAREFPGDHYSLGSDEWLVSSNSTVTEVAERLGVVGPTSIGNAIIFKMATYYGRAPTAIWDWIKAKIEAAGE